MKRIFSIIITIILVLMLTGCGTSIQRLENGSMFVTVEETMDWRVVYHRDTKVMYIVGNCGTKGVFTVLVNPDGTPMLWDGE